MNKYLEKIAEQDDDGPSHDLRRTGVIAGLGTAGTLAATKIINHIPRLGMVGKVGVAGGLGLLADYAAVKTNKKIDKIEKTAHSNKYLSKLAGWIGDPSLVEMLDRNAGSREVVDTVRKTGLPAYAIFYPKLANPALIEIRY